MGRKYKVLLSPEFKKEYNKLPKKIREISKKRLTDLETNPKKGIALKGDLFGYRALHYHQNKYRIIYTIEEEIVKILALAIGKRTDDFYEKFKHELNKRKNSFKVRTKK